MDSVGRGPWDAAEPLPLRPRLALWRLRVPLVPDWIDIGFRLLCCFLACLVIGLDREWQERAAGMRTTILVGLASCFAMISANLLLTHLHGDTTNDFARADVLRLPLGILTGMGFIGAGAIMRRGDGLVHGVTTAATLWYVTVLGLCFGAGQFVLGGLSFALGLLTLWVLKHLEHRLARAREAQLGLSLSRDGPSEADITDLLARHGARIRRIQARIEPGSGRRDYRFTFWTHSTPGAVPPFVAALQERPGVDQIDWEM